MSIVITGTNGFIGGHLIDGLKNINNDIKIIDRNLNLKYDNLYFAQLEIDKHTNYLEVLAGCEVLIHCAARAHIMNDTSSNPFEEYRNVNTLGTLNLARQAAQAGVKRFIFLSSVKVNGESTTSNIPFTSSDKPNPLDFYGQSKSEAEEGLLLLAKETNLEVVIIRPPLVFGAGVKANFASLMNVISKGFPLPFGLINTNKRSLVAVENLVDLIITCIDHPNAKNQIFLVSDDHDLSTYELVKELSIALNRRSRQLPVPIFCFKLASKLLNNNAIDRLIGSLQVDITHTKETLNWHPPYSIKSCFKKTATAFLQSKR